MDRCRDAADIVTLSVGVGVGAKAQVGPVAPGLIYNEDFLGLNSGRPFARWSQTSQGYAADGSYLFWGMYSGYGPKERFKRYDTEHILGIPLRESVLDGFMGKRVKLEYPAPYFTQFEAVVGLGLSVRAGVNPGELVDFVLGFAGIDIYSDDIGVKKKQEIEQDSPSLSGAD